jgi:sensor histidine kinase YesM
MSSLPATHPLDLIPLFRRWPRSPTRDVVYTGVWSSMVGVVLAGLQSLFSGHYTFLDFLLPMVMTSNIVGYQIHGGLVGVNLLLRGWPSRQTGAVRQVYYVVTVTMLTLSGVAMGNAIVQGHNPFHYLSRFGTLMPLLPFALATALLMFAITGASERRARQEVEAARQREDIAAAAQLLAEARLRALQAQIEPHFLYNTLAGVLSLIDSQPARARHMLERFIDFLRASLNASRAERATVGAELDLAAAYLDVLAVRMGGRLRYRIEADAAVRSLQIAPMLIQPLVENAVMHGLEPKIEGGTIVLAASMEGDALVITVQDDGVGIGHAPPRAGGGVGLSNLKARVRSLHGPEGKLELLDNDNGGARVRLFLPSPLPLPQPSGAVP